MSLTWLKAKHELNCLFIQTLRDLVLSYFFYFLLNTLETLQYSITCVHAILVDIVYETIKRIVTLIMEFKSINLLNIYLQPFISCCCQTFSFLFLIRF